MNQIHTKNIRSLAIAPSTRGFGFAVMEGHEILVDWGVKSFNTDKSKREIKKATELMDHYQPNVIILPKEVTLRPRRSRRSLTLALAIIRLAKSRRIKLVMFSRQQEQELFFKDVKGNRQALAEILAKRFPEELGSRMPRKRKPWMSEDYRMDIFKAVALALLLFASRGVTPTRPKLEFRTSAQFC